jgi:hypothetical protein
MDRAAYQELDPDRPHVLGQERRWLRADHFLLLRQVVRAALGAGWRSSSSMLVSSVKEADQYPASRGLGMHVRS